MDAGAVAAQGGEDRPGIVVGHGLFERAVDDQPIQTVLQTTAAQIQQAFKHLATVFQLDARLVFHGAGGGGLDGQVGGATTTNSNNASTPAIRV
jgi:hypothetical protein